MHPYNAGIQKILQKNKCIENIQPMKAYMRNQFEYFGLKSTPRRELCSAYFKSKPLPDGNELKKIIKELWALPEREFQYFAIELLIKSKKQWTPDDSPFHEYLITNKSWWDSVDTLASHVVGPWFKLYPEQIKTITGKWNRSENFWLQRMSLLFQLKYKKETDTVLLTNYINHLSKSKEFFVQKAIGWILREYSKTNPPWVKKFVKENELMPLSK
jgi:3-methyladenine DNA glycosylase AlkD